MLGAIIGDIVGSVCEFDNIKTKDFPLFREDCMFTDDTVLTLATAAAGFMAREGKSKAEIKSYIKERYGYDLSQTLAEIRPTYMLKGQFRGAIDKESCQQSVPQAIICFLESTDFEDVIRNAVSLGGDSDTMAAIVGGIAQAAFGVPDDIRERAMGYLDEPLLGAVRAFEHICANREPRTTGVA